MLITNANSLLMQIPHLCWSATSFSSLCNKINNFRIAYSSLIIAIYSSPSSNNLVKLEQDTVMSRFTGPLGVEFEPGGSRGMVYWGATYIDFDKTCFRDRIAR